MEYPFSCMQELMGTLTVLSQKLEVTKVFLLGLRENCVFKRTVQVLWANDNSWNQIFRKLKHF